LASAQFRNPSSHFVGKNREFTKRMQSTEVFCKLMKNSLLLTGNDPKFRFSRTPP
jgi:hypothetical protein